MSSFDDLIEARRSKRAESPEFKMVELDGGTELIELRFVELAGLEWAQITAKYPPRIDVALDANYGYDFHSATLHAAPLSGVRIVDGEHVKLSEKQWAELFAVLSGHEVAQIADAVWALNEWAPSQRIAKLKKASRADSAPSSN